MQQHHLPFESLLFLPLLAFEFEYLTKLFEKHLQYTLFLCFLYQTPTYKREKDNTQFVFRQKGPHIASSSSINSKKTVYYSYR